MHLDFRPLTEAIGAEALGVDLSRSLGDDAFARIHRAWLDHAILLFRGQEALTPAGQVAFTRRFGPLEPHTLPQFCLPEQPEIFVVSNIRENDRPVGAARAGWGWHSDSHYLEVPSAGSFLLARQVPREGGETAFANLYAAYDALSAAMKARIEDLEVLVSRRKAYPISYPHRPPLTGEEAARVPDVVHRIVRTHPETGRKALFVGGIVAWEIVDHAYEAGRALLDELRAHATEARFVYNHRWRVGDAILWDNRCTLHRALPFDDANDRRLMHRTTVLGTDRF